MEIKKRIHCFLSGRVQGVGFRNFTKKNAKALNLKGHVKNLPNGKVELDAEGPKDKLKCF